MRICHVIPQLDVGGAERLVLAMVNAGAEAHDITVISLTEDAALKEQIENSGARVVLLSTGTGFSFATVIELAKEFLRHRPDVIHSHCMSAMTYVFFSVLISPRMWFQRVVHTQHSPESPPARMNKLLRYMTGWVFDACLAVSDQVMQKMLSAYPRIRKHQVQGNGVPLPDLPAQLQRTNGVFSIISVGRLHPVKNQALLLRVVKSLREQNIPVELTLLGDGPESENLQLLARELAIEAAVNFVGEVNNVDQYLLHSQCFVLSSDSEGQPMAVLEAMAAGLPVVATDVGQLAKMLAQQPEEMLVPPRDDLAMVTCLKMLYENPEVCHRCATANRARVRSEFSIDACVEAYYRIYRGGRVQA